MEEKNIIEHLHNFGLWTSLKIKYPGSNIMNERLIESKTHACSGDDT